MLEGFKKSEFSRNVLTLFTGSALSQAIPFIALPFLQKYFFTPADFGILAIFISFCELFTNISCLKLEYGIVLQKRLKDSINLAFGAIRISWIISFISFILVLIFKKDIAIHFNEPNIENYLFLLPIYILFVGFNDVLSYWFNRKKGFKNISNSKVIQTSSAESIKFSSGLLNFNFSGLLIGRVMGIGLSSLFLLFKFLKEDKSGLKLISRKHSNKTVKKNKKYVLFTTPSVFIGSLINATYLNLFLYYFGKETVGMIGVSMTYLAAGLGVISVSFSQVFYSKVAETKTKNELLKMYKRFAKNLSLVALLPILFVYLIPTNWVVYLLGDTWSELMGIARIMVLWLGVWFVSSSLSFIYLRLGKQKQMLFFDFIHLGLIILGFYTAYFFNPTVNSALWGFTIAQVVFYLFVIYIAIRFIKKSVDEDPIQKICMS